MDQGLIPQRYARALYKVALERKCTEPLYQLMKKLAGTFASEPQLVRVIENPFVEVAQKQTLLLTAAGVDDADKSVAVGTFVDFIKLLELNRRVDFVRDAALAYIALYRKECHISTVTVTSAAPLAPEASKRLMALINGQNPDGVIEYSEKVDPELIGGFTVEIDNKRLDASVRNELKQLRLKLLSH